jgi:hypothetical protein
MKINKNNPKEKKKKKRKEGLGIQRFMFEWARQA